MNPTTEQNVTLDQGESAAFVQSYFDAFAAHNLAACVDAYRDDATLHFVAGVYNGKSAIEEWHRERFAAELKILRIDAITSDRDAVTVDLVVASKRLQFFRLSSLAGRGVLRLDGGKIKEARFSPRFCDPFEGW
jgi:hypothetical protein